ncbi:hypothetical protein VZT92_025444 [Zoarces viviparus]|uniref:Uncharacterized protein n=1 Tax=Zoarces viviparus TaxID=48416 RepID=A0AAW1DX89_ZOAVI
MLEVTITLWIHHPQGQASGSGAMQTGGGSGGRPGRADRRQHRLALGTWNVTSLAGKEPELVQEVERYQLDIVELTSTNN